MRIHLLSDLHLESGPYQLPPDMPAFDVLVAAGDIGSGTLGVDFLKTIGAPVVYVLGNHEYYSDGAAVDMADRLQEIRDAAAGSNVHVLENDAVVIDGVRFLGTTLWTNFGNRDANLVRHAVQRMNDYRYIGARKWFETPGNLESFLTFGERDWDVKQMREAADKARFHPLVAASLCDKSVAWLTEQLATPFGGHTVVVTHHHPSFESLRKFGVSEDLLVPAHWGGRHDDLVRVAAYASDLDKLLGKRRSAISAWFSGHLHTGMDYLHMGVRVVGNPHGGYMAPLDEKSALGYALLGMHVTPKEIERDRESRLTDPYPGWGFGFDSRKIVDLDAGFAAFVRECCDQIAGAMQDLAEEVRELAPYVTHDDRLIRRSTAEAIDERCNRFEKMFEAALRDLIKNLVLDKSSLAYSPGVTSMLGRLQVQAPDASLTLHGFRCHGVDYTPDPEFGGKTLMQEVESVQVAQARCLAILDELPGCVREAERQTKARIVLAFKALLDAGIDDARLSMRSNALGPWRHIHPSMPAAVVLTRGDRSDINEIVDAAVGTDLRRGGRSFYLDELRPYLDEERQVDEEFEEDYAAAFDLAALTALWADVLAPAADSGTS